MQFTPNQRREINEAKARGEARVTIDFTPVQKCEWEEAVERELAGKDENIVHLRKLQTAAAKPGFFGDVRRAIALSRRPVDKLAAEIGIDARLLSDFRAGEAELPSPVLDRLLDVLGLRLMQEIRR